VYSLGGEKAAPGKIRDSRNDPQFHEAFNRLSVTAGEGKELVDVGNNPDEHLEARTRCGSRLRGTNQELPGLLDSKHRQACSMIDDD
jgi:hypothetical protein